MTQETTFTVSEHEAGQRLDKVVVSRIDALGRRGAALAFERGAVTVAGRRAVKGQRARAGDEVTVVWHHPDVVEPEPDRSLDVRFESATVVVVHKPAGQPSVPSAESPSGSLAAALLARYPEMRDVGYRGREPGLLHRLDTGTSGLVVAARTAEAFEHLRRGLERGELTKRYLAIVEAAGLPAEGLIDDPLRPDRRSARVRVAAPNDPRARKADTHYRRLDLHGRWALVEVEVSRAYRHQIRVHLASIGHPIAGDSMYGGAHAEGLDEGRHALHAAHVAWAGDAWVEAFAVEADLPKDLTRLLSG